MRSRRQGNELRWWFCDSGKGIGPAEGTHLFDPFFCGRQAGRGLGLGLPAQPGSLARWREARCTGLPRPVRAPPFRSSLPLASPPEQVSPGAASHDAIARLRQATPRRRI